MARDKMKSLLPLLLAMDRWYQGFSQTTDEEVRELLERATERDTF
jgi:predicted phosphoribosyltransferase